jgi:hypothetical protein
MINSQEDFQTQIHLYTVLIQGVGTIFKDQYWRCCFKKWIFYAAMKIFKSFPLSPTAFKNDKVKFKATLRKLKIHPLTL